MWLYICVGLLVVVLAWVVYDTGNNILCKLLTIHAITVGIQ